MSAQRRRFTDDVRIGPISVIALIAILSMAVLAVLSISTANASLVISQRQAGAIADSYLAETAAQDFVAEVDAVLAGARKTGGGASAAGAVEKALPTIAQHAQNETGGEVVVYASVENGQINASFSCAGARTLNIKATIASNAMLHIDEWSMAAIQNTAEPAGTLWMGA